MTSQPIMSTCAAEGCDRTFTPDPRAPHQRFCSNDCRMAAFRRRRQREPHACPRCGAKHDPEDRAVLDALELELRDLVITRVVTGGELLKRLEAFIQRRRLITNRGQVIPEVIHEPKQQIHTR